MNLDDESLLSAYLDDELDSADRLAVEWSVESSPPLADQLRSLAIARDAVAGLGRPALPFDLAPAITAQLAADRRRARLQALARPGRIALAVAGLSAMAASLLFALLLLHRATHDRLDQLDVAQQNPEVEAPRTHLIPVPESDTDTNPTPSLPIVQNVAIPSPVQDPGPSLVERESAEEAREREDRLKITTMLENPEVRVILITTDVIDASGQIQTLIHDDARATPDFGRISLRTGLVVDPKRPGSAEVFVVSINEGGRESFVSRLREKFHELKEEDESRVPDLVTQLTEVGQVAIYQGTRASPLVAGPVEPRPFAVRTASGPAGDTYSDPRTGSMVGSDSPRPVNDRTPVDAKAFVGPPPRLKPVDPVTLVVWVTRPGRY
jgi:hypothetical protein